MTTMPISVPIAAPGPKRPRSRGGRDRRHRVRGHRMTVTRARAPGRRQCPVSGATSFAMSDGCRVTRSSTSASVVATSPAFAPEEPQGFRLPARGAVVHPRQPHELRVLAGDEVGERAAGQVGRAQAVTDVATGPRDAGRGVEGRGRVPVPGDAERPAPAVGDGARLGEHWRVAGNSSTSERRRCSNTRGHPIEAGFDATAPVVAGTAAAEREAVVGGALAVDQQVPVVAEGAPVLELQLVPHRVGQRLGRDHQRVQRQHATAGLRQRGRVPLEGDDDRLAAHGAAGGDDGSARPVEHLGLLEDPHAPRLERAGESAHELARVQACAVRIEGCPERSRRHQPCRGPRARSRPRRTGRLRPPRRARRRAGSRSARTRSCRPSRSRSRCPADAAARPTSSTVAIIARRIARAASRPWVRSSDAVDRGNRALHHPPLRPDAPNPAISFSSTAMRSAGSRSSRYHAVHRPVRPPPMIATSTSRSPGSGERGVRSSGTVSCQNESSR